MNMYGFYAPLAHNYRQTTQNGFGGINANKYADNGEVLSLLDMTSDEYPLLSTRPQRWRCGTYEGYVVGCGDANGQTAYITAKNGTYTFHYAGFEDKFTSEHSGGFKIAAAGDYVIIMPGMKYFDIRSLKVPAFPFDAFAANHTESGSFNQTMHWIDENGTARDYTFSEGELFRVEKRTSSSGSLRIYAPGMYRYTQGEARFAGYQFGDMRDRLEMPIIISNGTYAGEAASGNTLQFDPQTTIEINMYQRVFRIGDAVKISGCTHEQCNKTVVIRDIVDGKLIFDDNTFEMPEGVTRFTEAKAIVERDIPELDIMFAHNNRVWGAKGRDIYCSKAGDPLVWSDYESLADGCWWADSGCTDIYGITGGISYTYPRFFSEGHIYTIYGDTPSDFTIVPTQAQGVALGSERSLAIVNGMLIYLSPHGFMAYTGSLPQKIDYALNRQTYTAGAVSDGMKYFAHTSDADGLHLFVYDAARNLWHEESAPVIEGMWKGVNIGYYAGCEMWTLGNVREKPLDVGNTGGFFGDRPHGKVVFADFTIDTVNRKQLKSIILRHDGELTVRVYFDGELFGEKLISGSGKHTSIVPCAPRRCDHWHIELEGDGPWTVYSIAAEMTEGSAR